MDLYISHLVEIFREVRRVLRSDGTCWANIADSYAGGSINQPGLKPKDMCLIPFRLAIALQNDGWWVRQDIIWEKPSPMPESVTSRCTKSHEYLLLLAKAEKYYFDHIAIREVSSTQWNSANSTFANPGEKKRNIIFEQGMRTHGGDTFHPDIERFTRNKRSVWTINTESSGHLHFAIMPQALVVPTILAGTSSKGYCKKCGEPWKRTVISQCIQGQYRVGAKATGNYGGQGTSTSTLGSTLPHHERSPKTMTTGWQKPCNCETNDVVPGLVLDPFMGSGSVALVAKKLGRDYLGIELNESYIDIANERLQSIEIPLFEEPEILPEQLGLF